MYCSQPTRYSNLQGIPMYKVLVLNSKESTTAYTAYTAYTTVLVESKELAPPYGKSWIRTDKQCTISTPFLRGGSRFRIFRIFNQSHAKILQIHF